MLRTTQLIRANEAVFPDCVYYLPLLSKARRNARKHPDICIEICKSTLEGMGKMIILGLDPAATKSDIDRRDADAIVKWAVNQLRQNDDVVETNFVTRATSLANALSALRNVRSDIGHGREAPKPEQSTEDFARLCMQMTDALACYMLSAYFRIKSRPQESKPDLDRAPDDNEVDEAQESDEPEIDYDASSEFNDFLDALFPLPGKLLYSEALYRLYYEDYRIELALFAETLAGAEAELEAESDTA